MARDSFRIPSPGGLRDEARRAAREIPVVVGEVVEAGLGDGGAGSFPGRSRAYAIYVDDEDQVWLSDFGANALVRFDPVSERFASFPTDRSSANVRQLLGRRGEVWGAESGTDRLVRVRHDKGP